MRVKNARKQKGQTQADLAEAIGKTFETISNIETGKNYPAIQTLNDIASELDVPLVAFFDDDSSADNNTRSRLYEEAKSVMQSLGDKQLRLLIQIAEAIDRAD